MTIPYLDKETEKIKNHSTEVRCMSKYWCTLNQEQKAEFFKLLMKECIPDLKKETAQKSNSHLESLLFD